MFLQNPNGPILNFVKATFSLSLAISTVLTTGVVFSAELDSLIGDTALDLQREYDKRLRDVPETLRVMDADYIDKTNAVNISDLLERVVGVHITRKFYGSSAVSQLRGNSSNWLILHNGVRLERTLPELLALPVADIKRLEILKGSHYTLYGVSGISGTINIITHGPEENRLTVGSTVGSDKTGQFWVRNSRKYTNFGYSAYVYGYKTDGMNDTIENDSQGLIDEQLGTNATTAPNSGNFDRQITDARLTLEFGDHWTFTQYLNNRSTGVGVGLLQALDPFGKENLQRLSSDLRYQETFGDYRVNGSFVFNKVVASFDDTRLLPAGTLGGLFPDGVIQSYGNTGTETHANIFVSKKTAKHKFEYGIAADYGETIVDFDRRNYTIQNGSQIPVPVGEVMDFSDTFPLFAKSWSGSEVHVLFRHLFNATDDLKMDYGFRLNYDNDYGYLFSPRLSMNYSAGLDTTINFNYGESSVPPSTIQLTSTGIFSPQGNPDLEPVKKRSAELSAFHAFTSKYDAEFTVFVNNREDEIDDVPSDESPNGQRFANLKNSQYAYGFEFLNKWRPTDNIQLEFGGSFQNSLSDDSASVITPSFVPHFEANYTYKKDWNFNFHLISVVDRDRRNNDLRDKINDYAIANLTVQKKNLFKNVDAKIGIQNLFNSDAREDISRELIDDLPFLPFHAFVGLKATF